jgi:hypothetical protein
MLYLKHDILDYNRQYAESIEARLRQHALIIDIIVIPEDLTVPNMVEEAARQKFLFAIIINTQNETHKSLTLNILHGTPQGKKFLLWKWGNFRYDVFLLSSCLLITYFIVLTNECYI